MSKKMMSETSNISPNQQLEERLSNMHEQMAGVTSRLDRTERELDLERAMREDIISREVARRMAEAEKRIREELEAENASRREELDTREAALNKHEENTKPERMKNEGGTCFTEQLHFGI